MKGADPKRVGAVVGDLAGGEEIFALRELMKGLGSPNLDCRQPDAGLDPALGRASYIFNPTIAGLEAAVIGTGMVGNGACDNRRLIDVNAQIRTHSVEVVGAKLRGYMTGMKAISSAD